MITWIQADKQDKNTGRHSRHENPNQSLLCCPKVDVHVPGYLYPCIPPFICQLCKILIVCLDSMETQEVF